MNFPELITTLSELLEYHKNQFDQAMLSKKELKNQLRNIKLFLIRGKTNIHGDNTRLHVTIFYSAFIMLFLRNKLCKFHYL